MPIDEFESTGSCPSNIEEAEELFLKGEIERLPEWHPVLYMFDKEITRDFLRYLLKVRQLVQSLSSQYEIARDARRANDDNSELAACLEILSRWNEFSPLEQTTIERSQVDYYVDRASIILMRQKNPRKAAEVMESYFSGPFCWSCRERRPATHQKICKRFQRAQNLG